MRRPKRQLNTPTLLFLIVVREEDEMIRNLGVTLAVAGALLIAVRLLKRSLMISSHQPHVRLHPHSTSTPSDSESQLAWS
jgi:hypothetical protein